MKYRFDQIAFNSTAKKTPTESDKEHYIGLEHIDSECLEISRWGSDVAPIGEKLIMKRGDVLFGKRRAYQRKLAIAPFDGIFSAHGMVLRPNEEIVDKDFFPFFMSSDMFMERAVQISVGGLSPTINWKDLREQEFNLPPLTEQKILAEKLWAAYRLKESYKKLLAATEEMVKSQFIEMFEGDKYPYETLDCIAADWLKGQPFRKDEMEESGIHSCIHYGELFTKYGPVISQVQSYTNSEPKRLSKQGDILFPASDVTPNGLARCSMLPFDNVILGGDIIILRPKEGFNYGFLSYAINNQTFQLLTRVNGGVVKHMSSKSLKSVLIPIPPKDKQEEYIRIAHQADKSGFELRKSIEAIDQVIKSLINNQ